MTNVQVTHHAIVAWRVRWIGFGNIKSPLVGGVDAQAFTAWALFVPNVKERKMEHTCNKCKECGKASYEQLMACDACQEEVVNKIIELENDEFERMMVSGASSNRTSGDVSIRHELPRVRRSVDSGSKHNRLSGERSTDQGNVGEDS